MARILLRFTIKIGTKYLKRDVTFTGVSSVYYGFGDVSEQPYTYASHVYGATSLESSTNYYNLISPIFDQRDGDSISIPFYIVTPALTTDESGIDVTVDIFGRDQDGNNETALVNTSNADYNISVLRADIIDGTAGR